MKKRMRAEAFAFYKEIGQYVKKQNMLAAGDGVVAGVSGGADSMCLLYVLCALQEEYGLHLAVLHVNHGIRGEAADSDEEFVRRECKILGVPFYAVREDVPALAAKWGLTQEEAGRRARYRAFHRVADELGYKKIAVAHNENDNAETFLFQALRGSGIWGLAGIAPCRKEEGHTIIRPLLSVSRARIEAFLGQEGHGYCTDLTNLTPDYARNRIRNELLPMAEDAVNARAVSHLAQAAAQMYELKGFLEKQVEEAYRKVAKERGGPVDEESMADGHAYAEDKESAMYQEACKKEENGKTEETAFLKETEDIQVYLNISVWQQQPAFLQPEIALYAIGRAAGGRRDITRAHVEAVCSLMRRQTGRSIELPRGLCAVRRYDLVQIGPGGRAGAPRKAVSDPVQAKPGSAAKDKEFLQLDDMGVFPVDTFPKTFSFGSCELSIRLMEGGLAQSGAGNEKNSLNEKNCYAKCFDYGKIGNILVLRTKRPGDYILIHGGKNKKQLKALFTDMKVPAEYRGGLPLLTAGSHVLWAVGVRSSEGFPVTENTKQILVVELKKRGQELQWQKKSV